MKVLRSTLFVATAAFVAACGDKVNVQGPATTTPAVHSVSVAPATATLTNGQTLQLTAAVSADVGATTTPVVWSSSSTVAGVDQTGKVTAAAAPAAGSVGVCASVGGASGCATVVVVAGAGTTPATIQISSITGAAGLNFPVPVPPGAVAGQIDVRLNVTANSVKLDSVNVTVDGATAGKQTFSAAQAAALITADGLGLQTTPQNIVISVNTANFVPATGATSWKNGLHAIGAVAYGKFLGTTSAATATAGQSVSLIFGNANGFIGKLTFTPTATQTATATDAAGYGWKSGGMTVSAIPVLYSVTGAGANETVTSATFTFNNIGCSTAGGIGVRTLPLAQPVAPSAAWTGAFDNTSTSASTNLTGYEFNAVGGAGTCLAPGGAAFVSGGEIPSIVATGSDNNNLALVGGRAIGDGVGFLNSPAGTLFPDPNLIVRLDNVAPAGVAGSLVTNGRTNNWENDAVVLNGLQTGFAGVAAASTSANGAVLAGADNGSGRIIGTATGVTFTGRTGLGTDAAATVDGTAAVTSTAALAESATNGAYRLRIRGTDLLGNFANSSVGTFGVDRTAPVLTFAGGPAVNARNVLAAGSYTYAATDNSVSPAAPSGFFNLGATPLSVTSLKRNAAASTWWCPTSVAYQSAATACATWTSGTNYNANLIVSDENTFVGDAYYTVSATVADQAGNVSAAASRVELTDASAAAIGGLSYPPFLTAGGSATFTSTDNDNLDLQLERLNLAYGAIQPGVAGGFAATLFDASTAAAFAPTSAVGGSTFWFPDSPVNGYNLVPLVTTHSFAFTATNLLTQIQAVTTALGANPAALNAAGVVNTANGIVLNQANTATASATPIIAGAVPAAVAITNTGAAGAGPVTFPISGAAGTTLLSVSGAGGLGTSTSFTATAQGLTGVFTNPFSAVQFWAYEPTVAPLEGWRLIGTVTSATTTDAGGAPPLGRNWAYTVTWTPTAATAPNGANTGATVYKVVAIGIVGSAIPASTGMALASPLSAKLVSVAP